ncbi:hypothetical protein HYT53_04530 [Candidatus Woesearchaeota archaeon]|nr:hypothetical protein [Candidatus Woesearchaeota archaeon]
MKLTIFIVLALFLISSCAQTQTIEKTTTTPKSKSEVATSTKTASTSIQQQTKTLSEEKIIDIAEDCYDSETNQLVACYSDLAIKYNNPEFCDAMTKSYQMTSSNDPAFITTYKIRDEWVNFAILDYVIKCYIEYSVVKKDSSVSSICQTKYGNNKYIRKECYYNFAQKTNDKTVCKNIPEEYVKEDSTFRYYCYSAFPDYADMQARGEI